MALIAQTAETIDAVRRAAIAFERSPWRVAGRYLWLFARRFSHAEITTLALLDPAISRSQLRRYQSKESVWPVYEALNRHDNLLLLDDKARFHDECVRRGLPTIPVCLCVTRDELRSMASNNAQRAAVAALLARLPREFVVKPSFGLQGKGVEFFRHDGSAVTLAGGEVLAPERFLAKLAQQLGAPTMNARYSAGRHVLIFQPAVRAHPALQVLSGSEALQCARVCTVVDRNAHAVVLFAFLKITTGQNRIDNFSKGRTGNLLAYVDEVSGTISAAIALDPTHGVIRFIDTHPATRRRLVGAVVPDWREACTLATRAASAFPDTRAVGWDIAFTQDGPMLLEGNGTWDPVAPMYRKIPRRRGWATAWKSREVGGDSACPAHDA